MSLLPLACIGARLFDHASRSGRYGRGSLLMPIMFAGIQEKPVSRVWRGYTVLHPSCVLLLAGNLWSNFGSYGNPIREQESFHVGRGKRV
jgi:hypothetical protein